MARSILIRIIGHTSLPEHFSGAVRDTTIGKEYDALLVEDGEELPDGSYTTDEQGVFFIDDVGDECFAFTAAHVGHTIEIVE